MDCFIKLRRPHEIRKPCSMTGFGRRFPPCFESALHRACRSDATTILYFLSKLASAKMVASFKYRIRCSTDHSCSAGLCLGSSSARPFTQKSCFTDLQRRPLLRPPFPVHRAHAVLETLLFLPSDSRSPASPRAFRPSKRLLNPPVLLQAMSNFCRPGPTSCQFHRA